jgi:cob(I)alamin adenosyltransferase
MNGYVHVYTGNGKGKTTAAIGLAVRAVGAGWRVFFAQFLKAGVYSEHKALARFTDRLTIKSYGRAGYIREEPEEEDRRLAQEALEEIREVIASGRHGLVVLDEANVAVHYRLVSVEQLLDLIGGRPAGVEVVVTGRYADPRLLERADLVTEMREIKHYYHQGVTARLGVEK